MNYPRYRSAVLISALAALLMCPACASPPAQGSQQAVFPLSTGTNSIVQDNTSEISDLGIYPLPNLSGSPVRLKSVTIASPPPELHILNVRAYNYDQTKNVVIGSEGDLPTECPHQYKPHPVDSFITPAHATSRWFIVIEFTISKPGRYNLRRLRIDYTTDGRQGWQYLEIDTTMAVHDPPMPGLTPVPSSSVCDL
jgi:hypothetical protein